MSMFEGPPSTLNGSDNVSDSVSSYLYVSPVAEAKSVQLDWETGSIENAIQYVVDASIGMLKPVY